MVEGWEGIIFSFLMGPERAIAHVFYCIMLYNNTAVGIHSL